MHPELCQINYCNSTSITRSIINLPRKFRSARNEFCCSASERSLWSLRTEIQRPKSLSLMKYYLVPCLGPGQNHPPPSQNNDNGALHGRVNNKLIFEEINERDEIYCCHRYIKSNLSMGILNARAAGLPNGDSKFYRLNFMLENLKRNNRKQK